MRCQRTPAPILLQSRVVLYFFRRSLGTLTLFWNESVVWSWNIVSLASRAGGFKWRKLAWQGTWHEKTQHTPKLICIKGYDVQDTTSTFHVVVWNERDTLKGDQCHIWREPEYITRMNIMRKLLLSSVGVTNTKRIQGSTFSIGADLSRLRSCNRRRCWKRG